MENQDIEHLASTLKPTGTIERGDTKSIEQRGQGVAFKTQLKDEAIISQTVEMTDNSLTFNVATDTLEILCQGAPATPEQRNEVLHDVAYLLRKLPKRDNYSQNLLRKVEAVLLSAMDDQECTIMSTACPVAGNKAALGNEATMVSSTPQFAMMERTTIERLTFDPKELESKRHFPLPLWSIIAFAALFLITAIVLLVKL